MFCRLFLIKKKKEDKKMLCLNIPAENSMLECRVLFYEMTKTMKG